MNWITGVMTALPAIGSLFGDDSKEAGEKLKKKGKNLLKATNGITVPPFLYLISDPSVLEEFFTINPILGWVVLSFAGVGFIAGNVVGLFAMKEGKRKVKESN